MKQAAVNAFENRLHTSRRRSRFTHIGCFEADFFITHVSWTQRSGLIPLRFKLPLIQVAEYGEQWCGLHGLLRVPLPLLYFKIHSPGVQDVWIQDATWLCPLSTILPSKSVRGSSVIRLWAVIFLQPRWLAMPSPMTPTSAWRHAPWFAELAAIGSSPMAIS